VRRQHPIGGHIVDFAFPACKLAIELHGGQHADAKQQDNARTEISNASGYAVIRFWNGDVVENLEGVMETICSELAARAHLTPALSSLKGGEGE